MRVPVKRSARGPNQCRWSSRLVRLLGQVPDRKLAQRAGIHLQTVRAERRRRGIPPLRPRRPRIHWTRAMLVLLGTAIDRDVAAELGLPVMSVFQKRRKLGIPPFEPPRHRRQTFWTPRRVALLGTASDAEIARRLGVSATAVHYRRHVLGIPSFAPSWSWPRWTPAMLRLLGRAADREVARRLGLQVDAVRGERWRRHIPAHRPHPGAVVRHARLAPLLRRPTPEVCRLAGLGVNTVYQLRRDLGVPPPPRPSAWTPRTLALLGKLPDAVLARRLGLSKAWVARRRQRRGVRRVRAWTPEEDRLLGTASDEEVARRLGRTAAAVKHRRCRFARRASAAAAAGLRRGADGARASPRAGHAACPAAAADRWRAPLSQLGAGLAPAGRRAFGRRGPLNSCRSALTL